MQLKAGDLVLIDLEMAQTASSMAISQCCGRGYDPDDIHRLLRAAAEGEWRVAKIQVPASSCPYCGRWVPRPRDEISLEASSPVLIGGIEFRQWTLPRSWVRLAAGGS